MASIRKRVTARGEARYYVRWRDANGEQRETAAGPRHEDAKRLRVEIERRQALGPLYTETARASFGREGDEWLERQAGHVAEGTLRMRRSLWREAEQLHGLRVSDVDARAVERLVAAKAKTAPARAGHLLDLIRQVLGDCEQRGLVVDQRVRYVRRPRKGEAAHRYLEWREVEALVDAARHPDDAALLLVAATTGARWGEVCGLTADDVQGGVVQIHRQVDRLHSGRHSGLKTGRRSRRTIPIAEVARDRVAWCAERNPTGPLFPSRRGRYWPPTSFRQQVWLPALRGSGIEPCRFHDLRHTFAAHLVRANVHPKTMQRLLGHATIGITLDTYGHLMPEGEVEAIAALDALLARSAAS